MASDNDILPGLQLYIHEDAISEGTVYFKDDLSIEIDIPGTPDKDGWYHITQPVINQMLHAIRSLEITTYVGGGHFTVRNDPEKKEFHFNQHVPQDRKRAESQARMHAASLFAKKRQEGNKSADKQEKGK